MTHRGSQFFLVNWLKKARYKWRHFGTSKWSVQPPKNAQLLCRCVNPMPRIGPREHLTEREVERLVEAAKDNRWGHRDATMLLLAFRHGLRASELVDLRWESSVNIHANPVRRILSARNRSRAKSRPNNVRSVPIVDVLDMIICSQGAVSRPNRRPADVSANDRCD